MGKCKCNPVILFSCVVNGPAADATEHGLLHGLSMVRTRASTVRGRRLIACAMARPNPVICSYFFDGTVNGVSLLEVLRNFIRSEVTKSGIMEQVLFQQDRAPLHFIRTVREFLNEALPGPWIRRGIQHLLCHYHGSHPVVTSQHLITACGERCNTRWQYVVTVSTLNHELILLMPKPFDTRKDKKL
jgi:hypothetical protein